MDTKMRDALVRVIVSDLEKHGICPDKSVLYAIGHTLADAILDAIEIDERSIIDILGSHCYCNIEERFEALAKDIKNAKPLKIKEV